MSKRIRSHFRANVVGYLALCVALSGTAVASGVLNKKKVNNIISNRAPGLSVAHAKNADKLGGIAPSGYQGFCKAGGIKATLVINPAGFTSPTFQNVGGFNCFQPGNTSSSVQMKKLGTPGNYEVRFVGNKGPDASGSAVCSGTTNQNQIVTCYSQAGGVDAPGETVFIVYVFNPGGGTADDVPFSVLAF